MPISKVKSGSITDSAVTSAKINDSAVTSAKIQDGSIVNADINACAAIASSKLTVDTSALESDINTNKFNISLLGFKMAVNEGLTIFNLVDGVVDEFNDESGTDEAEGSNDNYCGTSDYYLNNTSPTGSSFANASAGFTTTSITEPDTSTTGTNPSYGSGSFGSFTVPACVSSVNLYTWGAGGGAFSGPSSPKQATGGGGGFASGTLAVTPGQSLTIVVGEGGEAGPGRGLGGASPNPNPSVPGPASTGANGGGLSGVFVGCVSTTISPLATVSATAPQAGVVAGAGGGGGHMNNPAVGIAPRTGGAGGGTTGQKGATLVIGQTASDDNGGGGGQSSGGDPGAGGNAQTGGLFLGGASNPDDNAGGGGSGFYGGGGATSVGSPQNTRTGGGGSSYYGHPQITCGSTEAGCQGSGGGTASPFYVAGTNEGTALNPTGDAGGVNASGEDGYVLIQSLTSASVTSTTIVSTAFTSSSVATNARIVVFEEDVDTPTLNTDIIASISRDAGVTFTNATLTDSGYVTGSSGQRILTGQADISGQPSGQSMRWKLALANNTVKIHGVSLQWS